MHQQIQELFHYSRAPEKNQTKWGLNQATPQWQLIPTKCLLCTMYLNKHFICICSFNPYNNFYVGIIFIIIFHIKEEMLWVSVNSPRPHISYSGARIQNQTAWLLETTFLRTLLSHTMQGTYKVYLYACIFKIYSNTLKHYPTVINKVKEHRNQKGFALGYKFRSSLTSSLIWVV